LADESSAVTTAAPPQATNEATAACTPSLPASGLDCRASLPRLIEAVEAYLATSPCSDPDCCARAIAHFEARENLAAVLATVKGAQVLLGRA
jgi:hypothetical protein